MFLFIPYLQVSTPEDTLVAATSEVFAPLKGDINGDGRVSSADYLLVRYYVLGTRDLSEEQKLRGDISGDGTLNDVDRRILQGVVLGYISLDEAPRIIFGDVDNDGKVALGDYARIKKFIDKTDYPTSRQTFVSDVDLSGIVDVADASLVNSFVAERIKKLPAKYGDLNGDLNISLADSLMVDKAINNVTGLAPEVVALANVFQDTAGKLDGLDMSTMRKYLLKTIYRLPVMPGDVNQDLKVSLADVVLLDRVVTGAVKTTDYYRLAGDVSIDGALTVEDTTILRKFVLGTITELPVVPQQQAVSEISSQ